MTLPASVRVAPHDVLISTDRARLADISDNSVPVVGHFTSRTSTITIDIEQGTSALADTLLHETLHAIIAQTGLDLDGELEEAIVSAVSPRLLGVLRDNPALVDYLVAT